LNRPSSQTSEYSHGLAWVTWSMIDTAIQRNQRGWHGVSSTDEQRSRPAASVQPRTPHIEAPDGSLSLSRGCGWFNGLCRRLTHRSNVPTGRLAAIRHAQPVISSSIPRTASSLHGRPIELFGSFTFVALDSLSPSHGQQVNETFDYSPS